MHSLHLTRGQRQFLGSKGISASEWDSMPPEKQKVWLEEMRNPQFKTDERLRNKRFTTSGNLMPNNHWTTEY